MDDARPLSPHLQVYRWQLTMVTSILHRATGIALAVGSALIVYWLMSLAGTPDQYARAVELLGSTVARIALAGWVIALYYHLLNGVRHLLWDAGWGFEIERAYLTGYLVAAGTVVLSAVTLWLAWGMAE